MLPRACLAKLKEENADAERFRWLVDRGMLTHSVLNVLLRDIDFTIDLAGSPTVRDVVDVAMVNERRSRDE
jgi:hypothetical protein